MADPAITVVADAVKLLAQDDRLTQADAEILLMAVRILRTLAEEDDEHD